MSDSPDTSGQNEAAKTMAEIAKEQWGNYKENYQPMEKRYVQDAENYDTAARREQYAGRANADVTQAYDDQRGQQNRQLAQYGISPDSGKFAVVNSRLRGQQAAQQAAAQNTSRQQVENTGWARKTDALSLGKGLPAQASAGLAAAGGIYNGITNNQVAANAQQSNQIGQGVSGGMQLYNQGSKAGWFSGANAAPTGAGMGYGAADASQAGAGLNGGAGAWASGGLVHFRDGGHVQRKQLRLSYGGPADALAMANAASAGAPAASGPSGTQKDIQTAQNARGAYNAGNRAQSMLPGSNTAGTADTVAGSTTPGTADIAGTAGIAGDASGSGAAVGSETASIGAGAGEAAAAETAGLGTAAAAETAGIGTAAAVGGAEAAAATAAPALAAAGPVGWAGLAALGAYALYEGSKHADGGRIDGTQGGDVQGPGTSTSDSIPALLSDGEFVMNAEAVQHFGLDKMKKMNEVGLKNRHGIK